MKYPKRGDVWSVNLNPTVGQEQQGQRPVFVISQESFNKSGLTVICPITQGGMQSRFAGFAVSLIGSGSKTQGVVMTNQIRTIDMRSRQGKFIESVEKFITDEVLARVQAITE